MENEEKQYSGITFKTETLKGYAVITQPMSKVELTVTRPVNEANKVVDQETGRARYIISLNAISLDKLDAVKELFRGKTEVPIEDTNSLFMTANVWVNNDVAVQLPMKGEKLFASIDWVTNREDEMVLRVRDIALKPAAKATLINLDEFLAEPEAESVGELEQASSQGSTPSLSDPEEEKKEEKTK